MCKHKEAKLEFILLRWAMFLLFYDGNIQILQFQQKLLGV